MFRVLGLLTQFHVFLPPCIVCFTGVYHVKIVVCNHMCLARDSSLNQLERMKQSDTFSKGLLMIEQLPKSPGKLRNGTMIPESQKYWPSIYAESRFWAERIKPQE